MLENLKETCKVIDISQRQQSENSFDFDFDSLIPDVEQLTPEEEQAITEAESKLKERQGFDCMPIGILNELLRYFLDRRDFRSVFWIVLQANTGLRYSDVIKYRRIDLLNEHNKFRESILEQERKTGKQRVNFINDAIKMATLMLLWENPSIKPLDLMISSEYNEKAHNKGYAKETYINAEGKKRCLRVNGKYVYKLNEKGNKIPTALGRSRSCTIMRDAMVEGLGICLKNDGRTKNNDGAYLKLASHSIRKAYSAGVVEQFEKMFDSNEAYAHAAAMEQLQYDLNHSSRAMTYHYIGDYAETKRKTNMAMNLGIEILRPYFEIEKSNSSMEK